MLCTLAETARLLGVHPVTVTRWANANAIPTTVINGRRYVSRLFIEQKLREATIPESEAQ